jgi:hypothetical protein
MPFEGRIEGFAYRSDADHDLADRAGQFVLIRLLVCRHGRQVVHAHFRWLGADEERMVNCDHRAIPVGRIISVGRVQSQRQKLRRQCIR